MGIVVKVVVGLLLFAGTLVGGLAATGRLNHDGVANIPGLNLLFPAPPEAPAEPAKDGEAGKAGEAAKAGDAVGAADHGAEPSDAAAATADAGEADAASKPRRKKVGRSLTEPEPTKDAHGGHGAADAHGGDAAGHGADAHAAAAADDHGKSGDAHGKTAGAAKPDDGHGKAAAAPAAGRTQPTATHAAQRDLQRFGDALASARTPYAPGNLYRFDGLPAGVSADQINEAWQRAQAQIAELDRRKAVLDQQEQQMREIGDDVSRRQAALGKERVEVEQMQRQLDARIQKFQQTVTLVRADEAAALKRNAQTLTSFEPAKAAELLEAQWKTERGQEEALKLMEFMDKDALNEILAAMPAATTADVLKKRLRVTKEAAAPPK
ncbi:MAG: hypothetical protein FJ306_11770 [Planctomycetes bacterium]|nr:hypothetical protein [Planctomycetota bacterium]